MRADVGGVAVVTDSTATLPAGLVDATGVVVVPLDVIVDGVPHREGVDITTDQIVEALRAGASVRTAHPGPDAFARAYARVAARGASEIVSVPLSGELSGTTTSANLAAREAPVPVHVVDSRTVGMGLGLAALAAARAAADGADGAAVARAAEERAARTSVRFTVETLEHLRAGGRLGALAATLGTVLGLRPVLEVRDGRIDVVEKVRTAARARDRVVELAVTDAAHRARVEMAVHHLGDAEGAERVAERLRAACGSALAAVHVAEISAVVGAHAGPGLLAVVVGDA